LAAAALLAFCLPARAEAPSVAAGAAQTPSSPATGGEYAFRFETGLVKPRVLIGEPVYLSIYATCLAMPPSAPPVEFDIQPYFGAGLRTTISWPDDLDLRYAGIREPGAYPDIAYQFSLGETRNFHPFDNAICYKLKDDHSDEGFVFRRPGTASIRLEIGFKLSGAFRVYRSKPLALEIAAPSTPADVKVLEAIEKDKALALALQNGVCRSEDCARIEALALAYPDSTYAPYLRYALLGGLALDESSGVEERQRRLRKALEVGAQMMRLDAGYYHLDEAMFRCASCYDRLGQPAKAGDEIQELMRRYPFFWRIVPAEKLFRRYVLRGEAPKDMPWSLSAR